MIVSSLRSVADVVGGKLVGGDERFSGVATATSDLTGGELFFGLRGKQTHGEQFVSEARKRGAVGAVVEHPEALGSFPGIVVPDSLRALQSLATWWRRQCGTPLVAITGSVGKTTTKEMAAAALASCGSGTWSQRSLNNHVGVPLTLLRLRPDDCWGVIEMGMNHAGEMEVLSRIAEPTVAAITTIAPAHIENFKDIHGIADAKAEILAGLTPKSLVVANGDDQVLLGGLSRRDPEELFPRRFFGVSRNSSLTILASRSLGEGGIEVDLRRGAEVATARMAIVGTHNATNVGCAVLCAMTLCPHLSLANAVENLSSFQAPEMRLALKRTPSGQVIVDGAYNANPASMASLFMVGADFVKQGKRIAILLGEMFELGERSEAYHREVAQGALGLKPTVLVGVGQGARWYQDEGSKAGFPVTLAQNAEQAAEILKQHHDFDVLLVKGGRRAGLERAVSRLISDESEYPTKPH